MVDCRIDPSWSLGYNVVIENGVTLGRNVRIGHNTVIFAGTVIADDVTIGCNSVVGCQPYQNSLVRNGVTGQGPLIIGEQSRIGNGVVLYSGTALGEGVLVADLASIRERVTIGNGTIIGRNAKIECRTAIGQRCVIQTGAYITADMVVEDDVFIGPEVSTSNDKYMSRAPYKLLGPRIRQGASIGNNATLLPGIVIGAKSVIGAGSVVTKDVPEYATVVGVPARVVNRADITAKED
ncbi:acyltransferase [Paenibacillus xerothermodurans]|uniref:N-acetyltransferase n=1 Tax=Paenibacillus xerothermodurans TaxID=1977292 RepID=A0A2W1NQJ7_PAEXE|nr:acyltransferase [Paenibacillus xerothermodurans]PZE21133.1 N-acetyltransferase [Paenibacillus xerothermodurans]